jgi:two-component system sensor histidine kinase VicK
VKKFVVLIYFKLLNLPAGCQLMVAASSNSIQEKVEIISDKEETEKIISAVLSRAKNCINVCLDKTTSTGESGIDSYQNGLSDAANRGVTVRYLTKITKENIEYCKDLLQKAHVYHIDTIKGNFVVTDSEYIANVPAKEKQLVTQLIYSNSKQIVEQHQFLFEVLCEKGISAFQRIKEIEEVFFAERTKVIHGEEQIVNTIIAWQYNAQKSWNLCVDSAIPSFSMSKQIRKGYRDAKARGVEIKYITEITKDNLEYCKEVMNFAQVRHLGGLVGNFAVSEKEYLGEGISKYFFSHLIYSNRKELVEQQNYLFDSLWNNAIPVEDRIKEIEHGIKPEETRILSDPIGIQQLFLDLIKSAISEISLIIATPNAFHRNQKIGVINLLRKAAEERDVKVNIVVPKYEESNPTTLNRIEGKVEKVATEEQENFYHDNSSFINIEELSTISPNFHVKRNVPYIRQTSSIKSTFLIIDRASSLILDLADDAKENLIDAVSFATYSSNKSRTQSYSFVFDTIWRQADVYEQLEVKTTELEKVSKELFAAYEQLKFHDAMQKEFINTAAHELRTPAQAICGYAEMLEEWPERNLEYEKAISRNAGRLYRLTTDILDVARIESQTLKLDKSKFDLNVKINHVISDIANTPPITDSSKMKNVKLNFEPKDSIIVFADKLRIFQVISNLLNNARKFTESGSITITAERRDHLNEAVVTITDTGRGIDPEILSRIFLKFTTKSETGTGLGLFISKSIVEAHGGKIWAYNNPDGHGATFTFTLPLGS